MLEQKWRKAMDTFSKDVIEERLNFATKFIEEGNNISEHRLQMFEKKSLLLNQTKQKFCFI